MAQARPEEKIREEEEAFQEKKMKETTKPPINGCSSNGSSSGNGSTSDGLCFKFNAQAPEFVPRSHATQTQMPLSGYFFPCFQYLGAAAGGSDWFFVGDHDPSAFLVSNPNLGISPTNNNNNNNNNNNTNPSNETTNFLTDDLRQKIIKQVEYQLSDMSLLANEFISKHVSKDPEGYVPVSVVASTKKMKSLTNNNSQWMVQALKFSSKLIVNEDGKKVKRKTPFTEKEKEELQSRTVVVENLPEDHSHQNLEKIFGAVGSVKTIRICHPQEPLCSRIKSDFLVSNKLHALVEFESPDIASKAVEKLNDERNWRKGLRVRLLLRCSPKSVLKSRKSEFDGLFDDEESPGPESTENSFQPNNAEPVIETSADSGASKKGWTRSRGKGRGRNQSHGGRGVLAPSPQSASTLPCEASAKQQPSKGPRMPDGTKGFTMGRGKPLIAPSLACSMVG